MVKVDPVTKKSAQYNQKWLYHVGRIEDTKPLTYRKTKT